MRMLRDNVLLKQRERAEKTKGGLYLPEDKQLKDDPIADIVAVGSQVKELSTGDTVVFGSYAGTWVTINDVEHLIMKEDDILAVIS